ncbi:homocitrate synthase NifV [Clostridium acidisoli DSM 12555]|uniref:Homocitrate synthase NifV n=1 Tax=Clostridium acidisoli DSM 12555 TaxID=1121291 RepID=A0A1W1XMP6_9CLOT|nr:hypothetical protein [Clostridium acidisoli]SMC25115.1 homocitrate synthase NifV [Clostridium acidisoli DSM 12555]
MSVILDKSKKIIIDRTLPEIIKKIKNIDGYEVLKFIKLLKKIGVDFIEIDQKTLLSLVEIQNSSQYIYRVENQSDLKFLYKYEFKYVVFDYSLVNEFSEKLLGRKIILEISIDDLDELFLDENKTIFNRFNIKILRIKDIKNCNFDGWSELIKDIKCRFFVDVDFCPSDIYSMGTAIAIEACIDGVESITATINGKGDSFAPLEEIILGLKVIKNATVIGNTTSIDDLKKCYKAITKEKIYSMKAILGEDIFKYESGIHVDGIEKNPTNYEPYNPIEIGTNRKMYIGKHSGKKAVMVRLNELHVKSNNININTLLDEIRDKSIELRRNIYDEELIVMCNHLLKKSGGI